MVAASVCDAMLWIARSLGGPEWYLTNLLSIGKREFDSLGAAALGCKFDMKRILQSPSAAERIAAAIEFARSFASDKELVLVGSSRQAIDDLVREFASKDGATFGLHRFSFTQLAARLGMETLVEAGIAPGSAIGAEALAVRASYDAQIGGELQYFSPIAKFPGFARAAATTIGDLRTAGVPEQSLKMLDGAGPDNAALLKRFQEQMADALVADRTTLLKAATDGVHGGAELAKHPMLFLDVPIHSEAERSLLLALVSSAQQVLFACPAADVRTLKNVRGIPDLVEQGPAQNESDGSSLARLRSFLFTEFAPRESAPDNSVVFFSAPGEERECVELARRILAEAESGIPFDHIAVLLRSPGSYSSLMEAAFRRAEIPAYFERGNRRPDPAGRALLALLACAGEDLSARRFAEYVSFSQVPELALDGVPVTRESSFIPPEDDALTSSWPAIDAQTQADETLGKDRQLSDSDSPELAGALRAPWKWEQLLVDAAVIGGRDRWKRRLTGLENQFKQELEQHAKEEPDSPRIAGMQRKLRNLEHLRDFSLVVIEHLAELPKLTNWGEWNAALEKLIPQVLRDPERVLAVIADMKPMAPVASVTLDEVRNVLQHWLANLQPQPAESRYGRVLVASPEQARGRTFDIVFVPGLAERIFPQKLREDPLLLDKLRRELSSDLSTLPDRSQQERLQLHIAVGAASRRLYLSYPRLEVAEARARVPSFYALDVARSITGQVPDYQVLAREAELAGASRLAWPAPRDPLAAIDDAEYDLSTVWPLLTTGQARAGRLAYVMKLNPFLRRSLRGRWARWQEKWSEYDGLFTDRPSTLRLLESNRLSARPYSATALQNFAVCPYRFLLSAIYGLEPREEPAALEEMDPRTRGALFHRMQADLQRQLQDRGWLPLKKAHVPQALEMLDDTIKRIADQAYEDLAPAIDRVWLDAIEAIRSDLRAWLEKVAEQDGWVPIHFEFGFGFGAAKGRDPESSPKVVGLSDGTLVHGVVDLIEQKEDGNALRVTDHKTGRDRVTKGIVVGHGEYLQPVLYGLAIEEVLKRAVLEGRLFYCTADGGFNEHQISLDRIARESMKIVLRTIDTAIERPFLVPAPREDACAYCDFQEVCGPHEEIRVAKKKENVTIVQLKAMRDLA